LAAVGGFRPAHLQRVLPAAIAGEAPALHTELTLPQAGPAPAEAEPGRLPPPPELPRVTVISRERHLAPVQHPDPVGFAIPPSDRRPDSPVVPLKEEIARPDASPPDDRLAQTPDLPSAPTEPKSRSQNQESGPPRNMSAPIAPVATPAAAAITSTEAPAAPPDDTAAAEEDVPQRIATPPEPLRAVVMPQEKPPAPARRFEPAGPALADPRPEPPGGPVAAPPPVGPEAAVRNPRPAPETPPSSPIVPGSIAQLPERSERGRQPAVVAPAAASAGAPSTESTFTPTSAAPAMGQEVLQRISGAVVDAAGGAVLSGAAPVAAAAIADQAPASAPTRALTIHIDLHERGAVHVRLALNGNALSLRMRADREEVAEQLRQDHVKLSDALSAAGYDTEIVAIEGRRNEIGPLPGNDAAAPAGTGADGAANADRGNGGENRRPTARQAETPNQGFGEDLLPYDQEDHEPRNIARRSTGALYV
jgi:hypothetical protein